MRSPPCRLRPAGPAFCDLDRLARLHDDREKRLLVSTSPIWVALLQFRRRGATPRSTVIALACIGCRGAAVVSVAVRAGRRARPVTLLAVAGGIAMAGTCCSRVKRSNAAVSNLPWDRLRFRRRSVDRGLGHADACRRFQFDDLVGTRRHGGRLTAHRPQRLQLVAAAVEPAFSVRRVGVSRYSPPCSVGALLQEALDWRTGFGRHPDPGGDRACKRVARDRTATDRAPFTLAAPLVGRDAQLPRRAPQTRAGIDEDRVIDRSQVREVRARIPVGRESDTGNRFAKFFDAAALLVTRAGGGRERAVQGALVPGDAVQIVSSNPRRAPMAWNIKIDARGQQDKCDRLPRDGVLWRPRAPARIGIAGTPTYSAVQLRTASAVAAGMQARSKIRLQQAAIAAGNRVSQKTAANDAARQPRADGWRSQPRR